MFLCFHLLLFFIDRGQLDAVFEHGTEQLSANILVNEFIPSIDNNTIIYDNCDWTNLTIKSMEIDTFTTMKRIKIIVSKRNASKCVEYDVLQVSYYFVLIQLIIIIQINISVKMENVI